jgi:hypothetical protein
MIALNQSTDDINTDLSSRSISEIYDAQLFGVILGDPIDRIIF